MHSNLITYELNERNTKNSHKIRLNQEDKDTDPFDHDKFLMLTNTDFHYLLNLQ